MILDKLTDTPSPKVTKRLMICSFIGILIMYGMMGIFFFSSGYPADFFTSQLLSNGAALKDHYARTANIDLYRIGQILDYVFMVFYGILIFSLCLNIGRKFEEDSKIRKSGYIMAILGPTAAILDGCENAFILAMLSNPSGFPDIWATIHSIFALIKWIILVSVILWALSMSILAKRRNF